MIVITKVWLGRWLRVKDVGIPGAQGPNDLSIGAIVREQVRKRAGGVLVDPELIGGILCGLVIAMTTTQRRR